MEPKRRMRDTTPEIQRRAKERRKQMTPAEMDVWKMLRKHRQAGFYFRRQHPVGRFILDFCCTAKKRFFVDLVAACLSSAARTDPADE